MFLIDDMLARHTLSGGIFAEHVHPELTDRILPLSSSGIMPEDVILIHHSFKNGLIDELVSLPCRKLLIYHNITKPDYFPADDPLRAAAIEGYQQLWRLKDEVSGSVCDSSFNARGLVARGFENVEPICLLSDFDSLLFRPSDGSPYHHFEDIFHILFTGRICPNKGQLDLVRVIPHVQHALGRKVHLTLCGHADHGGSYLADIHREIERLDIDRQVSLPGSVSNATLYGLYREADAYVSYSKHEGFGVPLVEAMAFGTPVFALDSTAVAETMGGAGWLLKTVSPGELADAICSVFRTRSGLRRVIRDQRKRVGELSIEQTFPRLMRFIARTFDLSLPDLDRGQSFERDKPIAGQVAFEGPFDGTYSLSQVNRNLAIAAQSAEAIEVVAIPREGTDEYVFDRSELNRTPKLLDVISNTVNATVPSVGIRNMYPPRARGQFADVRLHYLYWEESRLPIPLVKQINSQLDGMLAPTAYCAKVYRDSGVAVPIRIVGSGLVYRPAPPRSVPSSPKKPFVFLHVSSGLARKGVAELLDAYTMTFSAQDDVVLLIKTYQNASNVIPNLVDTYLSGAPNAPSIVVCFDHLTEDGIQGLYDLADAVVLPTRGEGFNLPAAEALLAGKLLLVTGTGAHMDFCNAENSVLLNWQFEYSRSHLAEVGSYWACVDVDDLARKMRGAVKGSLTTKPVFDYKEGGWDMVARNILAAASDIARERPAKEAIRLVSISSYNSKCGIAAYVETLLGELPKYLYDVEHWASDDVPVSKHLETPNVRRVWKNLDNTFESLCARIVEGRYDAVLVQFNFGFFELDDFFRGIQLLKSHEIVVHVVFHKTADSKLGSRKVSLRNHVPGLRAIGRIYVHDIGDVNYLQTFGIHQNVTLIPLFIPDLPTLSKSGVRTALGLPLDAPIVATNGFLLPNKGIPDLISAFARVRTYRKDAHLLLSTSIFPAPESRALEATCRELIQMLGLERNVTLITDFLALEQIHMLLSAADLIVYPYGHSRESASASVRQGLAARRPILGTRTPIFANVQDIIAVVPDTSSVTLGTKIVELLQDVDAQDRMAARVADFTRGQSPRDTAGIIAANIQQDIVSRDDVELPMMPASSDRAARRSSAGSTVLGQKNHQAILSQLIDREPSAHEIAAFEETIHADGGSLTDAVDGILLSDEYYQHVSLDMNRLAKLRLPFVDLDDLNRLEDDEFVASCYRELLGRTADAGGQAYFLAMIEGKPRAARNVVVKQMLASDEYKRLTVRRIVRGAIA